MRMKLLAGLATGLFIIGAVEIASAAIINFDSYTNVSGGGEVIGDEWLSDGILFSTPDAQLNLGSTTGSSPNSLGADVAGGSDNFSGSIYFEFINNSFVTDLTFTIFNTPFQAEAFDVDGISLNTISSGSNFTQYFDFSGYQVHSVMVSGTFYAIDDVSFSTPTASDPVPEPATMLLFGTGLVGLVGSRLRKKKK